MSFFLLYGWAIAAGVLAAIVLGMLGTWLAARDRAMQTLCLGQGATLGVLLGLGFGPYLSLEGEISHFIPFVGAVLVSFKTFYLSERMVVPRPASRNTIYTFVFGVLLAFSYLVSAIFPALENHMAQVFFGDLAVLTDHDAFKTIALSLVGFVICFRYWKPFSNQAFEASVLGIGKGERVRPGRRLFEILSFVAICFSVQLLGFLFTITCLFLPTSLLVLSGVAGLRRHILLSAGLVAVATLAGFALSLQFSRLPTVPTIVICMVVLSSPVIFLRSQNLLRAPSSVGPRERSDRL